MAVLEDVADKLAKQALDLMRETGDETIEKRVADEIGASSPTLQESFSTALRIRKAEQRALRLLEKLNPDVPAPQTKATSPSENSAKPMPDAVRSDVSNELEIADIISLPAPDARSNGEG